MFLAEATALPCGLLVAGLLTRRLGPEDYGLFAIAASLVAVIEWGITAVFTRATIKLVGESSDWRPIGSTVLRLHLVTGAAAAVILCAAAPFIAHLFHEPRLTTYLWLFAIDIPVWSVSRANRNILVGAGSFSEQALITAGYWLTRLLLVVVLIELGFKVEGAILGSIGASVVAVIAGWYFVRPPLFRASVAPARRLWSYAAPLFVFALAMRLFDKLDLFALKTLGGSAADTGIYAAAQNLAIVPGIFALSFSPLLLASLTRTIHDGDERRARELARDAMRVVLMLVPFAGMAAGASDEVVVTIFGDRFSPAAPLLAVLIFGAVALLMISTGTAILTAAGKPRWTAVIGVPLLPLAVSGHMLAIPSLGPIGAALVMTVCAGLGSVATVLSVHRLWRIYPPAWTLCRSGAICILAYVAADAWPASGMLLVAKLAVVGVLVPLTFLLMGELSARERTAVRAALQQLAGFGAPARST